MSKRKANADQSELPSKMEIDGDGSDSDDVSVVDADLEFNGLDPEIDFKGIRALLKQLFDTDNEAFNLTELSDLLLSQAEHVGTAIKFDGPESDPYAFISVLNLSQRQDNDIVKQLTTYLKFRTQTDAGLATVLALGPSVRLGLLFSERVINMPHQVVPHLYTMLQREMSLGGEAFSFTHLLILSKTYVEVQSTLDVEDDRPQKKNKKQKAQAKDAAEICYFHPEDEILEKHAVSVVSFEYDKKQDAGHSDSKRTFQDYGIKPQGRLILLEASQLEAATKAVGEYLGTN